MSLTIEPLLTTLVRACTEDRGLYTPIYLTAERLDANRKLQPLRTALPNNQVRRDLIIIFLLFILADDVKHDYSLGGNEWHLPMMTFPETASLRWLSNLFKADRFEQECVDRLQDLLTGFIGRHKTLGKGHLHPSDVEWAFRAGAGMLQGFETKFGVDMQLAVVANIQTATRQGWLRDHRALQTLLRDNLNIASVFAQR